MPDLHKAITAEAADVCAAAERVRVLAAACESAHLLAEVLLFLAGTRERLCDLEDRLGELADDDAIEAAEADATPVVPDAITPGPPCVEPQPFRESPPTWFTRRYL